MIFHKMNAESFRVFPYQGVIRILYKMNAESSRGHYFLVIIDSYITGCFRTINGSLAFRTKDTGQ